MRLVSDEWLYEVIVECEDWPAAEEWCNEHIGEWNVDWYKLGIDPVQWIVDDFKTIWYFKTEANAVLFKLRWT